MASTSQSRDDDDDEGNDTGFFSSCWGRLKLKLLWKSNSTSKRAITTTSATVGDHAPTTSTTSDVQKRSNTKAFMDMFKSTSSEPRRRRRRPKVRGRFKYDPLSYAQNFDEGSWDDGDVEDSYSRGFSSRFAAPVPKSSHNIAHQS
ncbi:hypothetical protein Scep_018476 [Stephania cephalantha]|uniref:Uncharacterized protein n=1 Tax=Stephania cephalantha TaxID=152367 RepID=A0AAP0I923_9MAGN